MGWDGDLEPLRPDDSISCVGSQGFKSRRRDAPLFDSRHARHRATPQSPPSTSTSSSKRPFLPLPSRTKPKLTTTTTTTTSTHTTPKAQQYRETPPVASRYFDAFKPTLPWRPPHSRTHSSTKHPVVIVEREPSYVSSSAKTASTRAPPRSNDRFYEYRRVDHVDGSRGRSSLDAGHRSAHGALSRTYSQDRGSSGGVYGALKGALRAVSRDRGSRSGHDRSSERDELRYGSRKESSRGSRSYVEARSGDSYGRTGDYRSYSYLRR